MFSCPPPLPRIVRCFSDVLEDYLYFDICHYHSGKYQNIEKPVKHQRSLGLPLETRKFTWTFGRPAILGNTTLGSSSPANPAFILSDPLSITIAGGPSLSSGASPVKAEIGLSPDASFTSVGASEVLSTGTVAAIMWWKICRAISHYTTWYFIPLCLLGIFFLSSADFFQNQLFKKIFREYHQSVKQFGSR